ncbi:MAG: PmoA family protein [Gemmataceae bacterium]|nr:PmoA family protein [Gemmataceae bacterium]
MKRWLLALALLAMPAAAQAGEDGVAVKVHKDSIEFFAGPQLVTRLHTLRYAKPIFWPLHAPNGAALTRDWPMAQRAPNKALDDHPHQKSAWWCHGDVIPEGLKLTSRVKGVEGVDFWSEAKGHGRQIVTHVSEPKIEKNKATVVLKIEWRSADDQKILDETRTIHFYNLGTARLIVMHSDLFASVTTIIFGDTKEGSFGIRVNDQIRADTVGKGKLQLAEGIVAQGIKSEAFNPCWGKVSAWCDASGPIDGKVAGIAIFADPKNPHATCWHARGYGLVAANPFGRSKSFPSLKDRKDLVRLAKGERLQFRYGLFLHDGDAETGAVADNYRRFTELRGNE